MRCCYECVDCLCVFFFKQKTAYEMRISDWSSDVCSSDLFDAAGDRGRQDVEVEGRHAAARARRAGAPAVQQDKGAVGAQTAKEIGRASCRERVCQYV